MNDIPQDKSYYPSVHFSFQNRSARSTLHPDSRIKATDHFTSSMRNPHEYTKLSTRSLNSL